MKYIDLAVGQQIEIAPGVFVRYLRPRHYAAEALLGIDAPREVRIVRGELLEERQARATPGRRLANTPWPVPPLRKAG
jgi:sRNA-binding carbon storage regulator CsrA